MRESNFSLTAQNRACICVSSALYDRRAIDAPCPSLPLITSLSHLSYLTSTSARIREILTLDGGLERLVRILRAAVSAPAREAIDEGLAELKGKGMTLEKGKRKSPFRPFKSYLHELELDSEEDGSGMVVDKTTGGVGGTGTQGKHLLYTYTLAFQCLVNIGVRGSESIRTRVVETGVLDVIVEILESYLKAAAKAKERKALEDQRAAAADDGEEEFANVVRRAKESSNTSSTTRHLDLPMRTSTPDTVVSMMGDDGNASTSEETGSNSGMDDEPSHQQPLRRGGRAKLSSRDSQQQHQQQEEEEDEDVVMADDDDDEDDKSARPTATAAAAAAAAAAEGGEGRLVYREEDVLLSLQLLAYLSKYPHVRDVFHSSRGLSATSKPNNTTAAAAASQQQQQQQGTNVFSVVEKFTYRAPPSTSSAAAAAAAAAGEDGLPPHPAEIQYWAGVVMRNACRKDDMRGGIRQCANMTCGTWERYPREFAKCRRCRKAKYCSKTCQQKAWHAGHRYWCAQATAKEDGEGDAETEECGEHLHHGHHGHGGQRVPPQSQTAQEIAGLLRRGGQGPHHHHPAGHGHGQQGMRAGMVRVSVQGVDDDDGPEEEDNEAAQALNALRALSDRGEVIAASPPPPPSTAPTTIAAASPSRAPTSTNTNNNRARHHHHGVNLHFGPGRLPPAMHPGAAAAVAGFDDMQGVDEASVAREMMDGGVGGFGFGLNNGLGGREGVVVAQLGDGRRRA